MPDITLLFIHTLTGLHSGSGTALGVVDLPVQRERHTDWPTIPGSSLKGVMRSACARALGRDDEDVLAAFGPEAASAHEHAGAVAFSDARLLAFPVRSLAGVFAWTTCPAVLGRLSRDLAIAGGGPLPEIPSPEQDVAACDPDSPLLAHEDRLMLEEFEFARGGACGEIGGWIADRATGDPRTGDRLRRHLAVLNDDDFTHFARHATEVVARVGLDYERKTVRTGALFYEEYVPAESLFYSLVTSGDSRRGSRPNDAGAISSWLQAHTPEAVQIGGGETVGKGICAVRYVDPGREGVR